MQLPVPLQTYEQSEIAELPLDGDEFGLMLVAAFCEAAYFDDAGEWARTCLRLIEAVARVCVVDRTWKQLLDLYRCVLFYFIFFNCYFYMRYVCLTRFFGSF